MERKSVGPFKILKRLGNNRRHRVFHARQTEQNRDVAIKFVKIPPTVQWDSAIDKIDREVAQLLKLRHPNLMQVYGAGCDGGDVFFATELIEGESLATLLSRRNKLAPDQVVEYGRQICSVLQFLHELDLIHSKLTPEKIMVTTDGQIKVIDLRLNRSKRRRWDAPRRRDLELAAYMAPEQFTQGASDKSDLYALGVILYEMLSGNLPYKPETLSRMQKNKVNAPVPSVATHVMDCPIWLNQIITEMLAPEPRNRPHSAQAINLALDEIKNIDATKQAAVSQMAAGFNPLTAGKDKSEARRLLGKKTPKKSGNSVPLMQRTLVQFLLLCLIASLIFFLLQPESDDKIILRAQQMVASEQMAQWSDARILLEPIMNSDRPMSDEASDLYYESKLKTLLARAELGKNSSTDSDSEKAFVQAVGLQKLGQDDEATKLFMRLLNDVDAADSDRHVRQAAKQHYASLIGKTQWPSSPDEILRRITLTEQAKTEDELLTVQAALIELTIQRTGEPSYEQVVSASADRLVEIKKQLAQIRAAETFILDSTDQEPSHQLLETEN